MRYNKRILHYFFNKKNFIGSIKNTKDVGVGEVGALACGDILKIFLRIVNDYIIDVKVMIFGCVTAFAASTYLAEVLINKSIYDALKIKNQDIVNALNLPAIKIHCSVLAQEALQKAIVDYLSKNKRQPINNLKCVGDGYFERKKLDGLFLDDEKNNINKFVISNFCATCILMSDININFTSFAFYKLKKFFNDNSGSFLFLYVEKFGCGFKYKYKVLKKNCIQSDYCMIDCIDFCIVFINNQYNYLYGIHIDFIEKNLSSYLIFRKDKNVMYCNCGITFNIKNII